MPRLVEEQNDPENAIDDSVQKSHALILKYKRIPIINSVIQFI